MAAPRSRRIRIGVQLTGVTRSQSSSDLPWACTVIDPALLLERFRSGRWRITAVPSPCSAASLNLSASKAREETLAVFGVHGGVEPEGRDHGYGACHRLEAPSRIELFKPGALDERAVLELVAQAVIQSDGR